jgi:hypothetical protein
MKKPLFIIGMLACILTACTQFEEPKQITQESENATTPVQTRAGAIAYTTLPDPYSLANMQAVYNNYGNRKTL